MTTTMISIKTKPEIKKKAMKYFEENLWISLSAWINIFLHHIAQGKKMDFSLSDENNNWIEANEPAEKVVDFLKKIK